MKDCFSRHAKVFPPGELAAIVAEARASGGDLVAAQIGAVQSALAQAKADHAEITGLIRAKVSPGTADLERRLADLEQGSTEARQRAAEEARVQAVADELQSIRDTAQARMGKMAPEQLAEALKAAPAVEDWMTPDERARANGLREDLTRMAAEAGWAQKGGRLIRNGEGANAEEIAMGRGGEAGEVVDRTKWIPHAEWFQRMRQDLGEKGLAGRGEIQAAANDWLQGKKLNVRAQRTVDWMIAEINAERDAWAQEHEVRLEEDVAVPDLIEFDIDPSGDELGIADLMAQAVAIDDAATERAAMQFEGDDNGLIEALKKIIEPAPVGVGEEDRTATEAEAIARGFTLKAYRGISRSKPFNESGTVWATTNRNVAESYAREVFGYDDADVLEIAINPYGIPRHDIRKLTDAQREALGADQFGNPQAIGIYDNSDDSMLGSGYSHTAIHVPAKNVVTLRGAESAAPALELQAPTPEDLKRRDQEVAARAEQEAEEAKKVEADKLRAGFALTGSDRAADVGAAAGQTGLFGQPRAAYNPNQLALVYDNLETRPGTTEVQRQTGVAALRALFSRDRRAGATLLGSALWKDFQSRGGAELIGQQVREPRDLATLAQILRDPRFETMRVFFTKKGKIVDHTAWTSRLPGLVAFSTGGMGLTAGANARLDQLSAQMKRAGADGYYLMHNHPSGIARPSSADKNLTQMIAADMRGFLGHVVIDHGEFGFIDKNGNAIVHGLPVPQRAVPEMAHDSLGVSISTPDALAKVAKTLQAKAGFITIMATGGEEGRVTGIAEMPESILRASKDPISRGRAIVRVKRFMNMTGAGGRSFIVGSNPSQYDWLINNGTVTDAVDLDGSGSRRSSGVQGKDQSPWSGRINVMRAEQGGSDQTLTAAFKRWFGDSKVVDAEGRPLVVYHGTNADVESFSHDARRSSAGFYFTDKAPKANMYAAARSMDGGRGANVMPVFLKMRNPKRVQFALESEAEQAKAEGHDGLITPNEWVVFNPEQIKSAIGNTGDFDPSNPNIAMQERSPYETAQQAFSATTGSVASRLDAAREAGYRSTARKVVDRVDQVFNPLGTLPEQQEYLTQRGLAQGVIAGADESVKELATVLWKASPTDEPAVFAYLTTAGAMPNQISDPAVKAAAVRIKDMIGQVGDELVERGMLDPESRERYRDAYLPRLYLKHLLSESDWKAIGSGKKPSDMGYLKARKDIPEDIRKVIMGEVQNPGFLAGVAISKPVRDMALLDWLGQISTNENWVLPGGTVEFTSTVTGRTIKATPYWLKEESGRLRKQARLQEPEVATRAKAEAEAMDTAADAALEEIQGEHSDYKQIPNTARYGRLRGLFVRTEIYNDLMGVNDFLPNDPGWFQNVFGYGGIGTKATQLWKGLKVAANIPSQVRNFVSNAVMVQLSGVPMHMVPARVLQAVEEMRTNGRHFQIGKKYGVAVSTFSSQEVFRLKTELLDLEAKTKGLNPLGKLHRMAALVMNRAGDFYQFSETIFKTALIIDGMERQGMTEAKAVQYAQDWLFDYSLVQKSVRYARNAPIGIPFLTYQSKVLPRLIEVAALHPQRLLPWVGLFYGLPMIMAAAMGVDADDLDRLKKALPEWLQDKRHAIILPYKDDFGRWQVVDLGYFLPWTTWTELAGNIGTGELGKAAQTAGLFGGPITDLVVAVKTGKDPFTGRDIYQKGDPPERQFAAIINYLWNVAAPPMVTDRGMVGPLGLYDKAYGGKAVQALTGTTDKWGDPRSTLGQAALYMAGLNLYGMNPEETRATNAQRMERELQDVKQQLRYKLQDQSLTPERRKEIALEYAQEMVRRGAKLQQYLQDSRISPTLH